MARRERKGRGAVVNDQCSFAYTDIGNAIQTVFHTFESRHVKTFRSAESSLIRVNVTTSLKKIIKGFR